MDLEHEKRLTEVEARAKSNTKRLDEMKPLVEEIHNMSETLIAMTTEMRYTNKDVREIKEKVETLEQEPAKRWKDSGKALFNAFLGAIGAACAGGFIYIISKFI